MATDAIEVTDFKYGLLKSSPRPFGGIGGHLLSVVYDVAQGLADYWDTIIRSFLRGIIRTVRPNYTAAAARQLCQAIACLFW